MSDNPSQKFEYVNCALCNLDVTESFAKDRCYNLVKCKRCGLVYINPRPKQEQLDKVYNMPVETGKGSMDHVGYSDLAYLHKLRAKKSLEVIQKYKKRGRILDIGCASGFFLNFAKQYGFEPYGIDISKAFCSFAEKNFKLDVFCGTLIERRFPYEYFDVITMFDVLSHLSAPVEELKEINRILRKEGLLLIETGNRGEVNAKIVERFGDVWGSPSHLYHFGTKTLLKLLESTGFNCLEMDKSPVILSSILETAVRRMMRSSKSREISYQRLQLGKMPSFIRKGLTKYGTQFYVLTKYNLGKAFPKSNLDCTMTVCAQKRR
jgi:SAM-dependent methyltransferase